MPRIASTRPSPVIVKKKVIKYRTADEVYEAWEKTALHVLVDNFKFGYIRAHCFGPARWKGDEGKMLYGRLVTMLEDRHKQGELLTRTPTQLAAAKNDDDDYVLQPVSYGGRGGLFFERVRKEKEAF